MSPSTGRDGPGGATTVSGGVVVVAMGNEYRRDDGAGAAALDGVRAGLGALGPIGARVVVTGPFTDPLDLLGEWDHADLAVVVDAVRTGTPPGTVTVLELGDDIGPEHVELVDGRPVSTHVMGVTAALRLARAVGRAPRRVVVVGIEGEDFGEGIGLAPAVEAGVAEAAARVLDIVGSSSRCA